MPLSPASLSNVSPLQRRVAVVALTMLVATILPETAVVAQETPAAGVTLKASPHIMRFGKTTLLSGAIDPAAPGETVNIVDENASVLASATTDEQGRYRVRYAPRHNIEVRAQWTAAFSDPVA